jgi:hypothetical protein
LKDEVAERLFAAWGRAPHETSRRLGQLILDGFCLPMRPTLRQALIASQNNRYERPAILQRVNEPTLTWACLESLLTQADIRELRSREWLALLTPVAAEATKLLVTRARTRSEVYSDNVIAELFYELRATAVNWHEVVEDESLPAVVRAAAEFGMPQGPSSPALIDLALAKSTDALLWHGFENAYRSTAWWRAHLTQRRDLVLSCVELKSPGRVTELQGLIADYLDQHDEILQEDWNWFAGAARAILAVKDPGGHFGKRIWEIVDKGRQRPVGFLLEGVIEASAEVDHDQLLNYLSSGHSSDARRAIIWYFERNAERKGLRLQRVNGEYRLTKMR